MPSNSWTQGTPLSGASIKTVLAERVYYAAADTVYADPSAKLIGTAPSGYTDLGIVVDSKVALVYTKDIKPVETGIEKVRRGSYSMSKTCTATFSLEQYDIDAISVLSGLGITSVGIIGGKLFLGQDDVVEKSLIFCGTNKVDGKEHQAYSKKASLNWSIEENSDMGRQLKVVAEMYAFTPVGETVDAFVTLYVLD